MQPGLFIEVLVLQSKRLVRILINPLTPFSDNPRRCIRRTTRDYRGCRSSRAVCRFDHCGNRRGIALRLGCCGRLGLRARSFLGRCKYRYTFRPTQCVGNDGMVFTVVERPFFAEVVAAFKHFAVGVITVVFVVGHQSVGLVVFDHDVVAVGKTAQFFCRRVRKRRSNRRSQNQLQQTAAVCRRRGRRIW